MERKESVVSIPGLDGVMYQYYPARRAVYSSEVCCTDTFSRDLRKDWPRQGPYEGCDYEKEGPDHRHSCGRIDRGDIKKLGVILGVTVRCVLTRTVVTAAKIGDRLVEEYGVRDGWWSGGFDAFHIRPHLEMINRCIVDRKIVTRYGTDTTGQMVIMDDVGLSVNFSIMDAALDAYARAYEWEHWPELLLYLGK